MTEKNKDTCTLKIIGKLDKELYLSLISKLEEFNELGTKYNLLILIDSNSGEPEYAYRLYHYIRGYCKIATVKAKVLKKCSSLTLPFLLIASRENRFANESSYFDFSLLYFFHEFRCLHKKTFLDKLLRRNNPKNDEFLRRNAISKKCNKVFINEIRYNTDIPTAYFIMIEFGYTESMTIRSSRFEEFNIATIQNRGQLITFE